MAARHLRARALALVVATLAAAAGPAGAHHVDSAYPPDPALTTLTASAGTGSAAITVTGMVALSLTVVGVPIKELEFYPFDLDPVTSWLPTRIDLADFSIVVTPDPIEGDTVLEGVLVSADLVSDPLPNLAMTSSDLIFDLSSLVVRLNRGHLILTGPGGTATRDLLRDPLLMTMAPIQLVTDFDTLLGVPPVFGNNRHLVLPIDASASVPELGVTLALQGVIDSGLIPDPIFGLAVACANGEDDDGDGLIDHPADPGCESLDDDRENPRCDDGFDNDFDGQIDFPLDPSCLVASQDFEAWACQDGIDNDGDGLVDHGDDPGCLSPTDDTEFSGCDDGIDNDGDLTTDYPEDTGCDSIADDEETDPNAPCDDGVDNDGDTRIDFPDDEGCLAPVSPKENPQCSDGINNDNDLLIDFDGGAGQNGGTPITGIDPQCLGQPWKDKEAKGGRCGLGVELGALALWLARRRRGGRAGRRGSATDRQSAAGG